MSIYHHFKKEEYPFVERALEMLRLVEERQITRLTDFLDPRQLFILQSLTSQVQDVKVSASGGYDEAERVRVLLHPAYIVPEDANFRLCLFEITGNQRFVALEHRDVMGALLHVGIKREKFGDILLNGETCQTVVAEEVADFVRMQVTHIHRIPVSLQELPLTDVKASEKKGKNKSFTVLSARLDAIIGEVCNLSRAKALLPIRAGKCKVNHKVVEDPSHSINQGDMISLGGFGRFEITEVTGPTKSGRLRLTAFIFT
ncbi:hypothetical protein EEL30_24400 [Brevibacillus laterosporus]|uniref:RNA-binding S4 domain-containing protein n=1 Tax=Brevibacillus laterosporus TaxID=1465 RepID=A0A518VDT0_BRELA|nr:hypothetical protein EEL30_24400 [Brevibacillus laterosporus]